MADQKTPFRDKMMKDRPLLTSLFGELAYDQAGAVALQKNQEPDDMYIDIPLNELPIPPVSIIPDIEIKKGEVRPVWPLSQAPEVFRKDIERGDVTKENFFWRALIDLSPLTTTTARKRQLAQELQNRYVKYALEGAKVKDHDVVGNLAVLRLGNGDTVPVPLDAKGKEILQEKGPEALLKYASEQKADKIGEDLYKALKDIAQNAPIGKKEIMWWIATSPYEIRVVDNRFRNEVDPDKPKTDVLNTNATEFYGRIVSEAAKDNELKQEMQEQGVPRSYVRALEFAGDVVDNNRQWLRGLTDAPNVAPSYGNATMRDAATWGAGTVMLVGGVGSALGGNLLLGAALILIAALILGYAIWKGTQEGGVHVREEKRRRSRKGYY